VIAIVAAFALSIGSGAGFAAAKGKGKGAGQSIAPGQSGMSGMAGAPGQTGNKPAHPETRGSKVSKDCAKIADPKLKDDCVKAIR